MLVITWVGCISENRFIQNHVHMNFFIVFRVELTLTFVPNLEVTLDLSHYLLKDQEVSELQNRFSCLWVSSGVAISVSRVLI
jgi:hypothetical protein